MQQFSSAQAEEALTHLTQHFAQWRQRRRTPRGRIPQELWAQAVALTTTLSVTRVAHQLGLTPYALKKRREVSNGLAAPLPSAQGPPFVEVAAAWRTPATEVEIQRPDGARLRIMYSEAAPALVPLLHAFLESCCCSTSRRKVASFWPCRPSTSAKGLRAWPRSVATSSTRIRWAARSTCFATARARR